MINPEKIKAICPYCNKPLMWNKEPNTGFFNFYFNCGCEDGRWKWCLDKKDGKWRYRNDNGWRDDKPKGKTIFVFR